MRAASATEKTKEEEQLGLMGRNKKGRNPGEISEPKGQMGHKMEEGPGGNFAGLLWAPSF